MRAPRVLVAFCLVLAFSTGAHAHSRSQSASDWQITGDRLDVVFSIDSRRATLLYGLEGTDESSIGQVLSDHLASNISVTQSGGPCTLEAAPQVLRASQGYERQRLAFQCPDPIESVQTTITVDAFFELSATHLHIIRVQSNGELVIERVLTGGANRIVLGTVSSGLSRLGSFISAGFGHVLSGWDHLAFLAALLLLAGSLRPMIFTITGFTLGHSLTMALVALGLLSPHAMAIEVLIGFSIAYAAMEAGAKRLSGRDRLILWSVVAVLGIGVALGALGSGTPWPPVLALLGICFFALTQGWQGGLRSWRAPLLAGMFGLAHGAGFAGALLDFDLVGAGVLWSLLGFNIGVELGQLAAVAMIIAAAFGFKIATKVELRTLVAPSAALLFGLGIFWTVSRLINTL